MRPVVNFDEKSKQLVAEARTPIPAAPGRAERFDYEHRRGGVANLYALCEAKAGWRHFAVTERPTEQGFAEQMRWLVDEQCTDCDDRRSSTGGVRLPAWSRLGRCADWKSCPSRCLRAVNCSWTVATPITQQSNLN